jgi:predicted ATPase
MFEVQVQDPIVVKGVDEPIQSYLVMRALPRSHRGGGRGIDGVETRMIGRGSEMLLLQEAFDNLVDCEHLSAITVVAEAGLGKSRLLYEFENWVKNQPVRHCLFRGRASPQTQGQPFGLLRDILAWHFQIADNDSIELARGKIEKGVMPLFTHEDGDDVAEGHAHLLGHLIGVEYRASKHIKGILDDPKQIRSRALHAAAQVFRRSTHVAGNPNQLPVVLQVEDLHWADNETLDFLNDLVETNSDVAMLMLCVSRPTLFERRATWLNGLKNKKIQLRRIDLHPLDSHASRELADEILQKLGDIPAALRELIAGRAEGNPFYMEELVKMLIDQGAIITGAQRWTLQAEKLLATQVPGTLTGVLQARLDGLPAPERQTLQEASVIGQVFWDQALIALGDNGKQNLASLVKRELTLPRPDAAVEGLREYAFKHQILHQVTYNTILKRTKRDLHGRLANWLSNLTGLRANDFLGITADHYEKAGEDANAAEYHTRAAEHAKSRFAHEAVLLHVERAMELLERCQGEMSETGIQTLQWRLLDVRERTLDLQGRRAEQRADIDRLETLAEKLDDNYRRAHAAWRRSNISLRTADWVTQESAARQAMTLAAAAGDDELRLLNARLVAAALTLQGEYEAGKQLATQALEEARTLQLAGVESVSLNTLALIASMQGDQVAALELDRQSLGITRNIGDKRYEAITLGNLGSGWMVLGDFDQATRDLERSLRLGRANGDRTMECITLGNLSHLSLRKNQFEQSLMLAKLAANIAVSVEARDFEAVAHFRLGDALQALDRYEESAAAYTHALTLAVEIDDPVQFDALAGMARLALAQHNVPLALEHANTLENHALDGGTFDGTDSIHLIELTCYEVFTSALDPRADEWLTKAHTHLCESAKSIGNPALRDGYLTKIREHMAINSAWLARQPSPVTSDPGH